MSGHPPPNGPLAPFSSSSTATFLSSTPSWRSDVCFPPHPCLFAEPTPELTRTMLDVPSSEAGSQFPRGALSLLPYQPGMRVLTVRLPLDMHETIQSRYLCATHSLYQSCLRYAYQQRVLAGFIVCGIIISEGTPNPSGYMAIPHSLMLSLYIVILLLRTYAIWEGKRAVLVILCISSVVRAPFLLALRVW
jgi:hypothetical protein